MYNTIDDAVELIRNAQSIIILTGAGISTCLACVLGLIPITLRQVYRVVFRTLDLVMACMPLYRILVNISWMIHNRCKCLFYPYAIVK